MIQVTNSTRTLNTKRAIKIKRQFEANPSFGTLSLKYSNWIETDLLEAESSNLSLISFSSLSLQRLGWRFVYCAVWLRPIPWSTLLVQPYPEQCHCHWRSAWTSNRDFKRWFPHTFVRGSLRPTCGGRRFLHHFYAHCFHRFKLVCGHYHAIYAWTNGDAHSIENQRFQGWRISQSTWSKK